jgi:predicted dehydrogenase
MFAADNRYRIPDCAEAATAYSRYSGRARVDPKASHWMVDTNATSDRSTPLRVGIVGCGAVAELYHVPALLASRDIDVVACVDPDVERARALAARIGASHALTAHGDLPGRVDLAIVAVPNAFHAPVAIDLLRAGVHVLVEKPMARSGAECDLMLAAASSSGVVLAVGHDFRHYPVARFARDLFAAEVLGTVLSVDVEQRAGGRWPSATTAVLSVEAGGGVLIDFGVHILDLLRWWLGDLRVLAYRDDAAGGVEAECACELELETGAAVGLQLSRTRTMRNTAIMTCERGTVELGIFEPAVVRLTLTEDHPPLDGVVPDQEFEGAPLRTVFARQLADVVAAIREGREPLVGGSDGRHAVAVVEACYAIRQPLRLPWHYPEAYASIGRKGP